MSNTSKQRRISARDLVRDIRAGLTDAELTTKYRIGRGTLERLIEQLLAAGAISGSELRRYSQLSGERGSVSAGGLAAKDMDWLVAKYGVSEHDREWLRKKCAASHKPRRGDVGDHVSRESRGVPGRMWSAIGRFLWRGAAFPFLLLKVAGYGLACIVFALCVFTLVNAADMRLLAQVKALAWVDPLPKARQLAEQKGYCEAIEYLDYFREYDYVRNDPGIAAFYERIKRERESWWFRSKDAFDGIWKGQGACFESLLSSTAADFMVVGDIRDLTWETVKTMKGQERDDFTVALAAAGMVLSGVTWTSGGAAAPVKGTVSLLKTAKRLDKISQPLQKSLLRVLTLTVEAKSVRPMRPLVVSIHTIATAPGIKVQDVMSVLSRSRGIEDLHRMGEFARRFGPKTGKFLCLGGDRSVTVFKRFGSSGHLGEAINEALPFGSKGMRLLERLGPDRFLKYAGYAKYGSRAARSAWKGRLQLLGAWLVARLPLVALVLLGGGTGLIAMGVPARRARLAWQRIRSAPAARA